MKKIFRVVVLVAMLATLFPSAAISASPADVTVHVRNQTGGAVGLSLTLPGGSPMFMTLEEGVTSFTITEGLYDFYASTLCGNQAGQWNINVTKTLYLTCKSGSIATTFAKQNTGKSGCDVGLYVIDGTGLEFLSWSIFEAMIIEVTFYISHGIVVSSPQEAADVFNQFGKPTLDYYAGCYDRVADYILP